MESRLKAVRRSREWSGGVAQRIADAVWHAFEVGQRRGASRHGPKHRPFRVGQARGDAEGQLVGILTLSLAGLALSLFAIERLPSLVAMIAEMPLM
jgi:hypothetical protein